MLSNLQESILPTFDEFRKVLDERNDRRERLIKSSRDITNLSKKVIFALHRLLTIRDTSSTEDFPNFAKEGRKKIEEIKPLFASLKDDLAGPRFWQHYKSISGGLQEFIEALSFVHYLESGSLLTFKEVELTLSDNEGIPYFPVPLDDYLLGVSDLYGELMRFAITAISKPGGYSNTRRVCNFVRNCRADFEGFTPYVANLGKKQAVTAQSLLKIEDVAYAATVRLAEYGDVGYLKTGFSGSRGGTESTGLQEHTDGIFGESSDAPKKKMKIVE